MDDEREPSGSLIAQFEPILASSREEDVQAFLKKNYHILLNAFGDRWAVNECIPKFKFGTEYVSDFVIVTGQSFRYDVTLVELEPPTERPFNHAGSYGKRLNGAIGQIQDWLSWIHDNAQYFRSSLAKVMRDDYGRSQIASSHERLSVQAKIVVGRRAMLSETDNKRRATIFDQHQGKLEIVPYDRLLDRAGQAPKNPYGR